MALSAVVDVYDHDDLFEPLDNEEVLRLSRLGGRSGFSATKNILRSTGIATRRLLRQGITTADLGERILTAMELRSGSSLADFDTILLCHSHTDPTACIRLAAELESRFSLPQGRIVAANHGCAGFLKLLQEGTSILEGLGQNGRVALVSVETPESWHDASDRLFCGIVSAGATAAVLEYGRGFTVSQVLADDFLIPASRRPNPDPLFRKDTTDVFCFRGEPCHRTVMRMNAEPVFLNGIELMLENLRSALQAVDRKPRSRVIVVPHQPSGKLLKALIAAAATEFHDVQFLNNLRSYGNTISSSIPTILSRLDEVLAANGCDLPAPGDHVILLAAGICMKEISNHMTAGHACLQWNPVSTPTAFQAKQISEVG
jgi:3-oxoacyl-[acyl-carrier-protein] synthase III